MQSTGSKPIEAQNILQLTSPIHMVLTKIYPDGTSSIVGIHSMEWRKVLSPSPPLLLSLTSPSLLSSSPPLPLSSYSFYFSFVFNA